MNILVTGGAGFIGSHIVDRCLAAGHKVAVLDSLWEEGGGKRTNLQPQTQFFHVDITNEDSLNQVFDTVRPEIVCHQAAQQSVAVSTQDPKLDARVNVLGLLNVLTNCTRVGTRKIVFASSGATYGTPVRLPIDEEVEQHPESPYGITKMVAEHYLRYWKEANGLTYTILRYGNVFGPRQDPNGEAGVIAIFARRFLNHETIRDIFCIGTGTGTSVNEIYQAMAKLIGYKPEIVRTPKRPGDIYLSYFDCSKAARILGWNAAVTLEEGIRATVEYFKKAE